MPPSTTDIPPSKNTGFTFDFDHPFAHVGKRILGVVVLLIGATWYLITHYAKGAETISAVAAISLYRVAFMLGTYLLYVGLQAMFYQSVYALFGFKRALRYCAYLFLSMNLVNTLAPLAGLSGAASMVIFEGKNGLSKSESVLINLIYYLIDYLVFLCALGIGIAYLGAKGVIINAILIPSLIFIVLVIGLFVSTVFLLSHKTALVSIGVWIVKVISKVTFRKELLVSRERIQEFAVSSQELWKTRVRPGKSLLKAVLAAAGLQISALFLIYLAFAAVGQVASWPVLIIGYTVGTLLYIVSITPGGIGVAEGGMTAVFIALGLPLEKVLVVIVLYRLVFAGFPLLLGIPALHFLIGRKKQAAHVQ